MAMVTWGIPSLLSLPQAPGMMCLGPHHATSQSWAWTIYRCIKVNIYIYIHTYYIILYYTILYYIILYYIIYCYILYHILCVIITFYFIYYYSISYFIRIRIISEGSLQPAFFLQEHFAQGRDLAEARALPEDSRLREVNSEGFAGEEEHLGTADVDLVILRWFSMDLMMGKSTGKPYI